MQKHKKNGTVNSKSKEPSLFITILIHCNNLLSKQCCIWLRSFDIDLPLPTALNNKPKSTGLCGTREKHMINITNMLHSWSY